MVFNQTLRGNFTGARAFLNDDTFEAHKAVNQGYVIEDITQVIRSNADISSAVAEATEAYTTDVLSRVPQPRSHAVHLVVARNPDIIDACLAIINNDNRIVP